MSLHRSKFRPLLVEPLEDRLLLSAGVSAPIPPADHTAPTSSSVDPADQYYPDQDEQTSEAMVVSSAPTGQGAASQQPSQTATAATPVLISGQPLTLTLVKYIEEQEHRQGRAEEEGKPYHEVTRAETLREQVRSLGVEISRVLAGNEAPRTADHSGQHVDSSSLPSRVGVEAVASPLRSELETTAPILSSGGLQPAARLFAVKMSAAEDERPDAVKARPTQDAVRVEEEQETCPGARQERVDDMLPEPGVPLAGLLPVDLKLLQQNVDAFFTQLSQLAEDHQPVRLCLKLAPWLGITMVAAWEVALLTQKKKAEDLNPESAICGTLVAAMGDDT